jgi:hypothetical protein
VTQPGVGSDEAGRLTHTASAPHRLPLDERELERCVLARALGTTSGDAGQARYHVSRG